MRPFLGATLLLVGAVSAPQPLSAVSPYRAILKAYRDAPTRAVQQLLKLSDGEIDGAVDDATRGGATPPWPVADLETAALMHTDVGLSLITGHDSHDSHGLAHVNRAERLLSRALDADPSAGWFVQRWYRFLRSRYLLTYSPRNVDAGGWHRIDVRLARRSGKVKARRGYQR